MSRNEELPADLQNLRLELPKRGDFHVGRVDGFQNTPVNEEYIFEEAEMTDNNNCVIQRFNNRYPDWESDIAESYSKSEELQRVTDEALRLYKSGVDPKTLPLALGVPQDIIHCIIGRYISDGGYTVKPKKWVVNSSTVSRTVMRFFGKGTWLLEQKRAGLKLSLLRREN